MKWKFLEGKASETLSTAATSSCNLSDVCVYLESKRSLCLRLIRGRHELTLWISGTGRAGAIIHNLWWSCMKVLACCQSSILIRSSHCASEYYFFLWDRIIITFYKSFFILKKYLFDQVHWSYVLDRCPPNSVLFCFWFWFVLHVVHCML